MNTEVVSRLQEVFKGFNVMEEHSTEADGSPWGISYPITSFFMPSNEIMRFGHIKFPFTVEIVAGIINSGTHGVSKSIQIRTPLSCVEDSSFNENFVQACCNACDAAFAHLIGQVEISYNIRLYNGLVMLFCNINEQGFLALNPVTQKQTITYFMQQLSIVNSFIRNELSDMGYDGML